MLHAAFNKGGKDGGYRMEKWKGALMWNIGRKQRVIDEEDHKGWFLYRLGGPPWSYKKNENKKVNK